MVYRTKGFVVFGMFVFLVLSLVLVNATISSSDNYNQEGFTQSGGGNTSSSNYGVDVVVGSVAGSTNSSNYNSEFGFFQTIVYDNVAPEIDFGVGTENDNEVSDLGGVYVNVSVSDTNLGTLVFRLYNASGEVNTTALVGVTSINFTGLSSGVYWYNVSANDSYGNVNATASRNITLVGSCLALSGCTEDGACTITEDCALHNALCSGAVCDFTDLTLNSGKKIYTGYNSLGAGRNLTLSVSGIVNSTSTLRSPITFLSNSGFVLNGRNGSVLDSEVNARKLGRNAGMLNITVPDLFNRTNFAVSAVGGYGRVDAVAGGNGGQIYVRARGWIQTAGTLSVGAGSSVGGLNGTAGGSWLTKDISCVRGEEFRDADVYDIGTEDVGGDGVIDGFDVLLVKAKYASISGEDNYNETADITCDNKINVPELARIGFEYKTRGS